MSAFTFVPVIRDNGEPVYKQIYDSVRAAILDGTLAAATQVPSTRALANDLGISRMTVVNAFDQLLAEGYLVGKAGSGTFVAAELPEEYLTTPKQKQGRRNKLERRLPLSSYGEYLERRSRPILENEAVTGLVPFQHGLAAIDEFPFGIWQKIANKCNQVSFRKLLSQNGPLGFEPLRHAVAEHLRTARAVNCTSNEVVITGGAQQGLDLISRIMLNTGDQVWMDEPGYLGARDAFSASGAKVLSAPRDADGFDLNFATKKYGTAKVIYTTPSHQFPVGGSMSINRRLEMIEWAEINDAWIIEDDYDSEFRYSGRPLASMQGLDRNGRVIYLGTFSKTIFSALRLGCVVVPPDLVSLFETARLITDGHSPLFEQAILAEFISGGHFSRHVRRMRKLYSERQEILLHAAEKYLKGKIEMEPASSGLHLIGWLPHGVSDTAFSTAAAKRGVRLAPLSDYAAKPLKHPGLLFGYAGFSAKQIISAMKLLADI